MSFSDLSALRVVWLDLDDTLIDFKANSRAALSNLYHLRAFDRLWSSPQVWIEAYEGHNIPLWVDYSVGLIDSATLRSERFRRPLTDAGMDNDEAIRLSNELDTQYLDLLAMERRLMPGALELLHHLKDKGYVTGVLSNGFADVQHRKMARAGIDNLIDITVLSDDIGVNKPDIRIFSYAQGLTQWPDNPSHHIMIGDNPATDIAGALSAGWKAIWLCHSQSSAASPEGAMTVNTLSEIIDLL
ncbi:MAG: YjjG family noncanonical pyrimidine nucleotidase [Pseudoflavonifractor sp.]|nr:YjjG family noncanonical pyrimidine nucleotidase [Alloprevotella sp.]MCM1116876.1 YjjG family noncanonical pyrimidine nucleotidase [Pseudoflavonifractor sp.]